MPWGPITFLSRAITSWRRFIGAVHDWHHDDVTWLPGIVLTQSGYKSSRTRVSATDSRPIIPGHRQAHGARRRRPGALLGWGEALKKPVWRSRHLCGRAHRWRAGGGQKQPKKRRKRPRRQIRGPNRKSLGGRHGKYNARTCPNRPNAQKIKRRAALADRPKQNGVPGPVRKPLKLF